MFSIFGFYKFKKLNNLKKNKSILQLYMSKHQAKGAVIIAKEGINGTISGKKKNLIKVRKKIHTIFQIKSFDNENNSVSKFQPFHKPKVKIKKEVVPIGLKLIKKIKQKNQYVEPEKWNKIVKAKETFLIDARKPFEHKVGTFKNAVSPNVKHFRDFPNYLKKIKKKNQYVEPEKWNKIVKTKETFLIDVRKPFEYKVGTFKNAINPNVRHFRDFPNYLKKIKKNHPVAMFCTGGIRCEKASVFLQNKGFKKVYQLKGGILNYLEKIKKEKSLWNGECFVFDNRISVKHKLKQGTYSICGGCRTPVSTLEKKSKKYEAGVSCSNCHDNLSKNQKERFRMRQKQISLAKQLGKKHTFQKEFK